MSAGRSTPLPIHDNNHQRAHSAPSVEILPPAQRNKTAMRTARPLVTCSRITERPQSAISLSISTPRLSAWMHDHRVRFGPRKSSLFRPTSPHTRQFLETSVLRLAFVLDAHKLINIGRRESLHRYRSHMASRTPRTPAARVLTVQPA